MLIAFYPNGYQHQTPDKLRVAEPRDVSLAARHKLAAILDVMPSNKDGEPKRQIDAFRSTAPSCRLGDFQYFRHCDNTDTFYVKSHRGLCEIELIDIDETTQLTTPILTKDGREFIQLSH